MNTAEEILKNYKYANSLVEAYKKYDEVEKFPQGGQGCDKFDKSIDAKITFSMYMGYYGDSSIYSCAPNTSNLLNNAISNYLTENFNEIMDYSRDYIINNLKENVENLEKRIKKEREILIEILRSK